MHQSRALLKHRIRIFVLGLTALVLGLVGAFFVVQSRLSIQPGVSVVPPGIRLLLPGCVLLIVGAIVTIAKSLAGMEWESRFCIICSTTTRHFRTDPRFKDGRKIGDSYVCEKCGQKYLISVETNARQ